MLKRIFRRRFVFIFAFAFAAALAFFSQNALVKNAENAAQPEPQAAMLLPTGATMTDALAPGGDVDGDGRVDPGDTIQYTVTIPNPTIGAGTGMKFTNTITDPNLLFVANSLNSTPIAVDNSYDTVGNTQLQVSASQTVSPSIFVNGNVLSNDVDPDTGSNTGLTAVALTNAATAQGGSVTMQTDGTFVYTPAANFTGTDTFTYQASDGTANGSGTVTINVTGRVRYVKNDAAGPGDGRSNTPFNTLGGGQSATAGDTIYVFAGNGTTGNQSTGITLASNQRLIGAGVALTMPGITINGVSNPQILPAATQPLITNTNAGGNGVSVGTSTGVEIQGLNIAGNANSIDANFTGSAAGSLTIANNTVSSAGLEGIDINAGSTGSITLSINNNAVTSSGTGIDVTRTAGTTTVTSFSGNSISGNTNGTGIVLNTVVFDSNTASAGFQTVNVGNQFIGQSGNGVGLGGLNLTNVTGDLSFTDLDVFADNGSALFVSSTGVFNAATSTGFRIQVAANAATLNATSGSAANITNATIDLQLGAMLSNNSSSEGVLLNTVAGTFSAPTGSAINNATGADFSITGSGSVNSTYNGTITDDIGALVMISNQTGGTKSFTGAITDNNDGDGGELGISLTNNTGATISFSGGLLIRTTTNPAFTATGGGTVSVCDENPCNPTLTGSLVNTLTTTTGTALNVANTTIGTNKLEFRSISANGGANGIILNNTGTSGGLTVSGTGTTDGSGGTIQNITTRGADINTAKDIVLKNMNFTSANNTVDGGSAGVCDDLTLTGCNGAIVIKNTTGLATLDNLNITGTIVENGITAINVANLKLDNSVLANCGVINGASDGNESCVEAQNLSGNVTVNNTEISFSQQDCFAVVNNDTNVNMTVSNSNFHDTQSTNGDGGFQFRNFSRPVLTGSSSSGGMVPTATINVINNSLTRLNTQGIQVFSGDDSIVNLDINGNTINPEAGVGTGIDINANNTSTLNFNITNNPHIQSRGGAAVNITSFLSGHIEGRVNNNPHIEVLGSAGIPIKITPQETSQAIVLVDNNTVSNINGTEDTMIDVQSRFQTARADVTITRNTVTGEPTGVAGINLISGSSTAGESNITCGSIGGTDALANNVTNALNNTLRAFRVRNSDLSNTNRIYLEGFVTNTATTWTSRKNLPNDQAEVAVSLTGSAVAPSAPPGGTCQIVDTPTDFPIAPPSVLSFADKNIFRNDLSDQTPSEVLALIEPIFEHSISADSISHELIAVSGEAAPELILTDRAKASMTGAGYLETASAFFSEVSEKVGSAFSPTVSAQNKEAAQLSGETICVDADTNNATCAGAGWTQPQGKTVTITFRAVVANTQGLAQVSNQGTVSGSNFANILTDDPDMGAANDATVTVIDRTNVAVASNVNPAVFGQSVTFTATLTGSPARLSGNPTGTVQFKDNGSNIGAPVNVVAGAVNTATAQLTVNSLSVGNHTITAEYSGGNGYNANVGSLTNNPQVINKANTAVGVTSSQAPSITGQSVTFTATVNVSAPGGGTPTGTVSFLVGGNPEATCTNVALTGTTATCTLGNLPAGAHNIDAQYGGDTNFNNGSGSLAGGQSVSNTAVWDGSTSADWDENTNWATNLKPASGNGVSIPTAGVTNNPTISSSVSVNNLNEQSGRILNIAASGVLTVTNVCTIDGTMNVAGSFTCGSLSSAGTINFTGAAAQNIPALTYNNFGANNASGVALAGNATINGVLTLTSGIVNTNGNTLIIGNTGSITRTSGHVAGNLQKNFNSNTAFTFHVGDADGDYTPVLATPTANSAGANLTVSTTDATLSGMDATKSASRFWSLSGANLTTNLAFTYLVGDVNGNEANYKVWKKVGAGNPVSQCASPCVNTATHTVSVTGVNSFSDWTAGEGLATTAAQVEVGGRVLTANGRAIGNARVLMLDSAGNQTETRSNPFGFFRFRNITVGATYIFAVSHKSYEFANASQAHSIDDARNDINFIALESFGETLPE